MTKDVWRVTTGGYHYGSSCGNNNNANKKKLNVLLESESVRIPRKKKQRLSDGSVSTNTSTNEEKNNNSSTPTTTTTTTTKATNNTMTGKNDANLLNLSHKSGIDFGGPNHSSPSSSSLSDDSPPPSAAAAAAAVVSMKTKTMTTTRESTVNTHSSNNKENNQLKKTTTASPTTTTNVLELHNNTQQRPSVSTVTPTSPSPTTNNDRSVSNKKDVQKTKDGCSLGGGGGNQSVEGAIVENKNEKSHKEPITATTVLKKKEKEQVGRHDKGNDDEDDDVEMENGDDNEEEEDEKDDNRSLEEMDIVEDHSSSKTNATNNDDDVGENFFTREPFTTKELDAVEETVKEQMELSVSLLEKKNGYQVYKKWRTDKALAAAQEVTVGQQAEKQRLQEAIQDAKILGAPRLYQRRLFEIACRQNTIIHLGTGAGKTLIALMTIKHFAQDFDNLGKQTLFLVPSVALAIQQSTVLRSNLPYTVQVACYATNTTAKARKALQECQILVATHGAIHDLLMHYGDMFSMKNFNLLCIDECHYAIGSHSYATVMKRFFHTLPPENRPRVLGLTASPLVKVKPNHNEDNLAKMLQDLESILTATVVSPLMKKDSSSSSSLSYQNQPTGHHQQRVGGKVVPAFVQRKPAEERDIIFTAFQPSQLIPSFDDIKIHRSRERELAQLTQLYEDLGPLVLSIYCQTLAREVSRNSFERETTQQFQTLLNYFGHVAKVCNGLCQNCPQGGRSDKLLALEQLMEDVIEDNGSSETVVLIFVTRRITAMALNDFFRFRQKATAKRRWIRASEVRKEIPQKMLVDSNNSNNSIGSIIGSNNIGVYNHNLNHNSRSSLSASRRSSTVSDSSSRTTTPSVEILGSSPSTTSSMDQFADADESGMDVTTVSMEEKEAFVHPVVAPIVAFRNAAAAGSQFDDASDDDSQSAMDQYLHGVRGQLSSVEAKASAKFEEYDDGDGDGDGADLLQSPPVIVHESSASSVHVAAPLRLPKSKDSAHSAEVETSDKAPSTGGPNCKPQEDYVEMDIQDVFDGQFYWNDSWGQFDDSSSMDFSAVAEKETIRCQALVRNSTHIFKSLNMSRKSMKKEDKEAAKEAVNEEWLHTECKIRDVLGGLRRGDINVLIATSVVEEGVDVQACSCVVAFDSLISAKTYVQMRGRARARDARFFVFRELCEKQSLSLDSAQVIEKKVHDFIASRAASAAHEPYRVESPTLPSTVPPPSGIYDCAELRAVEAGIYKTKHGSVDMQYAKSLVNRYVLSLPIDPAARASKASLSAHLPSYTDRELYLPSHLPSLVRRIRLPEAYWNLGRKEKEQILAMMACVRLHVHGLLSERLLPLTRIDLQEMMLEKATQEPRDIPVKILSNYGLNGTNKRKLFVYPLLQKNARIANLHRILKSKGHSLAIISTEKLPNIPAMRVAHSGFGTVTCSIGDSVLAVDCTEPEFVIILKFFKLMMDSRWRRRTKNVYFRTKPFKGLSYMVPPYFVGCISADGKTIDFEQMVKLISESRRSEEARIEAVRTTSNVEGLAEPRLWAPLYDKNFTYISYGPSGKQCSAEFPNDRDKEKLDTYRDYFLQCRKYDVNDDCPLFDAQRLWVLPFSKASTEVEETDEFEPKKVTPSVHSTKHDVCKDLKSLLLPKEACMEIPMADPNFLLLATHLPQFLNHMQTTLTAFAFTEHCKQHMPRLAKCLTYMSEEQIAEMLTAKSCAEEDSYEKLEWLGDAVLKLVQTDSLMYSRDCYKWIEFLHEGDLSTLRSVMGCNNRLAVACQNLKIDHFLLTSPLGRGQWTPATLELYSPSVAESDNGEGDPLTETIGGKTHADVIESILGRVYLECGYEEATAVADELEISLPQLDDKSKALPDRSIKPKKRLLETASSFTGHAHFNRPDLVQEAFTHPTAMHPETPSYQRLEWVGDAVLCLAAREWIYQNFYHLEVGEMVSMEASLVSNETLAFLAIKRGLLQNLDHCDQTLPGKLEHQQWVTDELCRGLWGTDPPKVAADVVEALLGAVYLDSGFAPGIAAVSKILAPLCQSLEKMHSRPEKISMSMVHPRKGLQEVGGCLLYLKIMREETYAAKNPDARVWLGRRWGTPRHDNQKYVASIGCLGFQLVAVSDASAEVAGNRACAFAVAILKRHPSLGERLKTARTMVESKLTTEKKQTEAKAGQKARSPGKKQAKVSEEDEVTPQKSNPPKGRGFSHSKLGRGKSLDRLVAKKSANQQTPEHMVFTVPDKDAETEALAVTVAESVLND